MTQAELYAHFEKVRAGEQPDIADDENVMSQQMMPRVIKVQ